MFGLRKKTAGSCALVVDVGSGSVGLAIIHSQSAEELVKVVWSHREFSLLKNTGDQDSLKRLKTALINAFLELGHTGLKELNSYNSDLKIKDVQVAVSAPWSYTTTQVIKYSDEHPFVINEELIKQLSETAEKEAREAVTKNGVEEKGLKLVTNKIIGINVNGYKVHEVDDQEGREIDIAHVSALINKTLIDTVNEAVSKIIPGAATSFYSFMYIYYTTLDHMHPDTSEICLVDVTNEATELAIVREGVLHHVTHSDYGAFSLAREISTLCGIPEEEAYTFMKGASSLITNKLSKEKIDQLAAIVSSYELRLSALFHETGDSLSIPKTVFLHCDLNTEDFFSKHIKAGAREATNLDHMVHTVTSKLFKEDRPKDTAILLSAHYYHLNYQKHL